MARVVITTFGSIGDLHPYLAIAFELRRRGHVPVIAAGECYRGYVEMRGLEFRSVQPDCAWIGDAALMRRYMHPALGLLRVARERFYPVLRESYQQLLGAVDGADLLVSQVPIIARLVAEKTCVRWASTVHIPMFFFSAREVPLLPVAPRLVKKLRFLGPSFWRPTFSLVKRATRFTARPWDRFRAELGLPPASDLNPLLDSFSPLLVLALFSKLLAEKQPDWPPQTVVTGFPVYDGSEPAELAPELSSFMDSEPPPMVFTLGTAVSSCPGRFFEHSALAARELGRRAVLVLNDLRNRPASLHDGVLAVDRAPFTKLFPRASVIVHHGGIGSTGLAMLAGRPMLVVPHAWDQHDNADRVVRLGIARALPSHRYSAACTARELRLLLDEQTYFAAAARVAEQLNDENGAAAACDALEGLMNGHSFADRMTTI